MAVRVALLVVFATVAGALAQTEPTHIGAIDFFGYKGLDVYAVRATLPWREGERLPLSPDSPDNVRIVRARVQEAIDREATDVTFTCCDPQRRWLLYVGLPGESSRQPSFNPQPRGDIRFPPAIVTLRQQIDDASVDAIKAGIAGEDVSQGFSLLEYRPARDTQLALRRYALENEALILRVLESSSDAHHRAIAAQALGYGAASTRQVEALVKAGLDADGAVRNDAIRALSVLARAKPDLARRIPVRTFTGLMRSGKWTDRNKASLLLEALTAGRDPGVLKELRSDALDVLIEMARWKNAGHAFGARMMLGRIAGLDENRLFELATTDQAEAIVGAVTP